MKNPIQSITRAAAAMLLLFSIPALAQVPDLTAGGVLPSDRVINLGPTGLHGWMYHPLNSPNTSESRQIQVTKVDAGSPAAGLLAVGDVILGASGTGAVPAAFSTDARRRLAVAIAEAEARNPATLRLLRWRAGTTTTVNLTLQYLGAYSATAPYNCPKSAAILERGLDYVMANQNDDYAQLNTLALLAANNGDTIGKNKDRQERAATQALSLIPTPEEMASMLSPDEITRGGKAPWRLGHELIVLSEYYGATGDSRVLPTIEAIVAAISKGQSMFGTYGHGFANKNPDGSLNGPMDNGYGPVNNSGMLGMLGLVLARECGVATPRLEPAIQRALPFFGFYAGKGGIPYGEHLPMEGKHETNGKSGLAALAFRLQPGRENEARFFTKMAAAAANEREAGHAGTFFNQLWAPLGAAAGGEAAAAAHVQGITWLLDLSRRWDGGFEYHDLDDGNGFDAVGTDTYGKYIYYSTAPLLTYALPLRRLHITGRGQSPADWLTPAELADTVLASNYVATSRSTSELIADLGSFSPKVHARAAAEIGNRTAEHAGLLPTLHALASDPAGTSRPGACFALREIADASSAPVLAALLTDPDNNVRYASATALRFFPNAIRMGVLNTVLAAAASTARPLLPLDPEDPLHFDQGVIAMLLFYNGNTGNNPKGMLLGDLTGVDRNLLYPAIKAIAANPVGLCRSCLETPYGNLSRADLYALAEPIIESIVVAAPADAMFAIEGRRGGLNLLEAYDIAEGVPLCQQILTQNTKKRDTLISVLKQYAGGSTTVMPDPDVDKFCMDLIARGDLPVEAQAVLDAIAADPNPEPLLPLKSIHTVTPDAPTMTLPARSTVLRVAATDLAAVGTYHWRKVHGAGAVQFVGNNTAAAKNVPILIEPVPGHYLFEVKMSDKYGGLTEVYATVAVTLYNSSGGLPANAPPVAHSQSAAVPQATPTPVTLTATDPEGYPLNYTVTSGPSHGTLTGTAPDLLYTGDFSYTGSDSLTFQAMDSEGQVSSATITLTVNTRPGFDVAIYEPFDYPAGETLNGKSGLSEVGLAGSWSANTASLVTTGSLAQGALPVKGGKISGMADENKFGGSRAIKPSALAERGLLADGATLWLGALLGFDDPASADTGIALALANDSFSTNNGFGVWIKDDGTQLGSGIGVYLGSTGPNAKGGYSGPAQFRDLASGSGEFGMSLGEWSDLGIRVAGGGQHRFFVCRITWGATPADNDRLELYVVGSDLLLPSQPFSVLNVQVDQSTFDTLTWTRTGEVTLDEIRFGTNYQSVLVGNAEMPLDLTAPAPDPAGFALFPAAAGSSSITMSAAQRYDSYGVEYHFTCTAGGGHDSGWQSSPTYTDTGLTPGISYSYTVRARDLSPARNTTAPSGAASAMIGPSTSVPGVTGLAEATARSFLGTAGLTGNVSYLQSTVVPSGGVISQSPALGSVVLLGSAVDLVVSLGSGGGTPDTVAPTPDPMGFALTPAAAGPNSITMTATTAADPSGVQYYFTCVSGAGHDSGWQDSPSYTDQGLDPQGTYYYHVKARDKSANANETAASYIYGVVSFTGGGAGVVYEPFDAMTTGALEGQATSGVGLLGNWNGILNVLSGGLSYGSLPVSVGSVDNTVRRSGGYAATDNFKFNERQLLNDGKELWFSLLHRVPATISSIAQWSFALGTTYPGYVSPVSMGSGSDQGVGLVLSGTKSLSAAVWTNTGTTPNITAGPAFDLTSRLGSTILIVGKVTWGANGTSADRVDLYLPDTSLNLGGVVSSVSATINQAACDTIGIGGSNGTAAGTQNIDEIRFGASYFDVLGGDPNPPTLAGSDIVDNRSGGPVGTDTMVVYTVTFSKDIDAATMSAGDFGNAGTAEVSIGFITESTPGVFTVRVTPTSAGTLRLKVNAGAVITGASGKALDTSSAITDDTTLTVNSLNTAPVWNDETIVEADAVEDTAYTSTLADDADDADVNDELAFEKEGGPAWLSVAANGDLSGTPDNGDVGDNYFIIRVTDLHNASAVTALKITVINTNDAPTWNNNPIASATEDSPYSGSLVGNASDPDADDELAFAKVSGPAWLSVATNGMLSGTPGNGDVGADIAFTVSVTDGNIATPVSATLQITVINTNDAPTWNSNTIASATVGSAYIGTLAGNASDPDTGANLAFAKVSGPAWLSVATNGTLSGTPGNGDVGANVAFTVSVTDNIIATPVSATLRITVNGSAVIYEPFSQLSNADLTGQAASGNGLTGSNWLTSGESSMKVASGSLSYGGLPSSGNSLRNTARRQGNVVGINSALGNAGLLADGGVMWFSLLHKVGPANNTNANFGFALGTDAVRYVNDSQAIPSNGAGAGIGFRISNTDKLAAAIWAPGTAPNINAGPEVDLTPDDIGFGNTVLIVGKVTWGANGATADKVELYLPDTSLNLNGVKSTVYATINQSTLDSLTFCGSLSAPADYYNIDEIRFGASYDDVVAGGAPPTLAGSGIVDNQSGGPVNAGTTVTYTVTFSKDIDAATVSVADFGNAGTAEISIGSITESTPGVFTVQVTPTTSGTLQFKVNAGAVITGASGKALDTTNAIADDTTLSITAHPVIYEPFGQVSNATNDASLTPQATSAIGLTGNWATNGEGSMKVANGSLSYGSLATSGNFLRNTGRRQGNFAGINSALSNAGLLADGGVLWFSLLHKIGSANNTNANWGFALGTDAMRYVNDSQGIPFSGTGTGVGFRISNTDKLTAAIWAPGTAPNINAGPEVDLTPDDIGFGNTVLIVGKVTWGVNGATADTVDLYLPDTSLNLGDVKSTVSVMINQSTLDNITFCGSLTAPADYYNIDEIRFGQSYQSVIGNAGGVQGGVTIIADAQAWAASYPAADVSDPAADFDGDGLSNSEERIWGLNPTNPGSSHAIAKPLDPATGSFRYTRRDPALTHMKFTVWTSADLVTWTEDNGATQVRAAMADEVETVEVSISPGLRGGPKLFVQVRASP